MLGEEESLNVLPAKRGSPVGGERVACRVLRTGEGE